jgi:hypothetical protein
LRRYYCFFPSSRKENHCNRDSRNNHRRLVKDKGEVECYYCIKTSERWNAIIAEDKGDMAWYYCRKMGHTTWNYRFLANDVLKGKVKH